MNPDRLALLHGATDRQLGEPVQFMPKISGGYVAGGNDTSRTAATITGHYTEVPNAVRTSANSSNSGANAELRIGARAVKYSTSDLPFEAMIGDHVILLNRSGAEYRIAAVFPFDTDRTVVRLEVISQ